MRWLAPFIGLAASIFGCGSAPPPAPPAAPTAASPTQALMAASDSAEPAELTHLVGIVRWRNPNATLETIYRWTGIRLSGSDLAAQVIDSGLASALAFDAPVDGVVALNPRETTDVPLMAVSVGVRSVDAARRAFQTMGPVPEVRPGEFRVNLRQGKKKSDKPACLLLSARGAAPGRLLCGRRDQDVDALRGYMARALPERDLGAADLHLEMHAPPVVDIYAPIINQGLNVGAALARRKLELGEPTFDRALGTTATSLGEELRALLGDLDGVTLDVTLAPERANASVSVRMKGKQSWTAGTLAAQAPHAAEAPTMFWSIPATATSASYTYPPEHQRFDAIRRTLGELLDGFLAHQGLAPADRAPVAAIFDDKYANDSPWVTASGRFEQGASAKPAAKPAATPPADPLQAAIDGFGWYLAGIGTPNQTSDFVKAVASAINRPKLQALLRTKIAELLPADEAADGAGVLNGFTFKPAPAPKELPKGSLAFELAVTRDPPRASAANKKQPAKPPAPVKLQVLVVPESARTWVILGGDKTQLAKTVLAATEAAPLAGKLGSRSDLSALKEGKYTSGSFTTLQSFLEPFFGGAARLPFDSDAKRSASEARSMLESTPNRGKTPILFTSDVALENGVSWRSRFDVPKGVIEDAIVLVASSKLMLPRP
jgi:hypothetical protein